jgi:UDP-N-acetylmuramate dehydrogenase
LVNYGNASGEQIHQLAKEIQETVFKNFRISLEIEVNVMQ